MDHVVVDLLSVYPDVREVKKGSDASCCEAGKIECERNFHDYRLVGNDVDVLVSVFGVAGYLLEERLPPSCLHVLPLARRDSSADEPRFLLRHRGVDA